MHPTYADTFFLRVVGLSKATGPAVHPSASGEYQVSDRSLFHLNLHFYCERLPGDGGRLSISTDSETIRIASGAEREMTSRYDAIETWIHVLPAFGRTKSEITVLAETGPDTAPRSKVTLPVEIRRSSRFLTAQTAVSGSAADLLALPAILGPGAPLAVRILSAAAGAVLLAVGTAVLRSGIR